MRSYVREPMRHGRLFLAGDAAHIVPPTGAKGLHLAVGDVVTFARALAHRGRTGSDELPDAYSATCLRRVRQAERFSYDMTTMLHRAPDPTGFEERLQLARLEPIASCRAAGADLAEAYTASRSAGPGRCRTPVDLRPIPAVSRIGHEWPRPSPGITRPRSVFRSRTRERSFPGSRVDPLPFHYS